MTPPFEPTEQPMFPAMQYVRTDLYIAMERVCAAAKEAHAYIKFIENGIGLSVERRHNEVSDALYCALEELRKAKE